MNEGKSRIMRTVTYGLAALAIVVAVGACTPMTTTQGNALDPKLVGEIKPGQHNRAQVARLLGTPSSMATFDKNTWYYISKNTEQVAFFQPTTVEQKVIVIKFDADGIVTTVSEYNGDTAREVETVDRVTPTRGQEMSLMGQLYKTLLRGAGSALGDSSEENEGFVP